jgi:hypothetical protein
MRKLLLGTILMALTLVASVPATAGVNINIGIPLPPPIVFPSPPDVIVVPDTNNVYAVPDMDVDMYFWNGWWWRLWEGRWYRSHYHNRGWGYYNSVPRFYHDVDPGWRGYYRDRNWRGHNWDYQRVPNRQLQKNWKGWRDNRHWEKRGNWGVQNYQPQTRQLSQEQHQQKPNVHQNQQPSQERRHNQPQIQHPQQHSQPMEQRHQGESQHQHSQGRHEGRGEEHGR